MTAEQVLRTALSLSERARLARRNGLERSALSESDREVVWPTYADLMRVKKWDLRLSALGLDDESFWAILSDDALDVTSADALIDDSARFIAGTIANSGPCSYPAAYDNGLPALPGGIEAFAVSTFHEALKRAGLDQWTELTGQEVHRLLVLPFLQRMHAFVTPTVVVDMAERSQRGELSGATPEERFSFFERELTSSPKWVEELLTRYPVMTRRLARAIYTRCDAVAELLAHWRDNQVVVRQRFGIALDDRLVEIEGPLGDAHRGGRGVFCFRFNSGRRLIYKPRSLALDVAFQSLLAWVNDQHPAHEHAFLTTVDCGTHGWVEFVEGHDCSSTAEVERFYWRQGSYLALLYLLGGRDFFFENIMSRSEWPFLIDLECVMSPLMPPMQAMFRNSVGRRFMAESVLSIGLLPEWSWGTDTDSGVNVSGLTIVDGQLLPKEIPVWENLRRDDVCMVSRQMRLTASHVHLPHIEGKPIPLNDYLPCLVEGFRGTYALLAKHSAALHGADGPLSKFGEARARVIIRPTADYARLLQAASHPDYLQHAVDFDGLLDRLFNSLSPRFSERVIQAEIDQLWGVDIPYFETQGNTRGIWDGYGRQVDAEFFPESALDGIHRRLSRFSSEDCQRQVEIIERSVMLLGTPIVDTDSPFVNIGEVDAAGSDVQSRTVPSHVLVAEASALADRLLATAISDQVSLTWLALSMSYDGKWMQGSLDLGLYEGAEGIALFLLYLGEMTGEKRFREPAEMVIRGTAVGGLRTLASERAWAKQWVRRFPGGLTFPASSLYLAMNAEHVMGESLLTEELIDSSLDWFEAGLDTTPRYDFLAGAASLIQVLLMLERHYGSSRALKVAIRHGELLRTAATPMEKGGHAWKEAYFDDHLGGFAHGVSGIAPALFQLAQRTGDDRFHALAVGAVKYDRALFNEDWQDWVDLRYADKAPSFAGWCHGAAGVALGRSLCRPFLTGETAYVDAEIDRGVKRLLRNDFETSDCLCHGNMGNIDILLAISQFTGRPEFREHADQWLKATWERSRSRGVWRCGLIDRNVALPGLFMGLAGIGYAILRSLDPGRVPCVMVLQDPRATPEQRPSQR
jgi:type 2 lantibiotic biosynthesis protein LanM